MSEIEEVRTALTVQRDLYLIHRDKILFVVDRGDWIPVIHEVFQGYGHLVVLIEPIEQPGQDYPLPQLIADYSTVLWLITKVSASHSNSTRRLVERAKSKGIDLFLISNPGYFTPDWASALDPANRAGCYRNAIAIMDAIGGNVGGKIFIDSDDGTQLILGVPTGNWITEAGIREMPGTNGPFGELCTAPYSAFGRYVLQPGDFLTNPINEVTEPIALWFARGKLEGIEGGKQADQLRNTLARARDYRAFNIGEFSFGVNPGKPEKLHRSVIAEKLVGGIHIAIGTNSMCLQESCPEIHLFHYGRYNAGVHIDAIKFGATVRFVPRKNASAEPIPVKIVEKGKLVV